MRNLAYRQETKKTHTKGRIFTCRIVGRTSTILGSLVGPALGGIAGPVIKSIFGGEKRHTAASLLRQ